MTALELLMATPESAAEHAAREITAIEAAADAYAIATKAEAVFEFDRANVKARAIRRLMETTNPATGKAHSASSAADAVHGDAEYDAHCFNVRNAAAATIIFRGRFEAAKRRADLAVGLALAAIPAATRRAF